MELDVEKLKAEKERLISDLAATESNVQSMREQLEAKENRITEVTSKFEQRMSIDKSKSEESSSVVEKEVITSLRQELESYKRDIMQLRGDNEMLQKSLAGEIKDETEPGSRLESEIKNLKDREKQKMTEFDSLRSALIKDLENRCQKVVELEILLDETRDQYVTLLGQVKSSNAKSLQQKCIFLQKNVEQLTINNQQLQSENSKIKLENQVAEKQLHVRNDRIQSLEHLLLDSQEKHHKLQLENQERSGKAMPSAPRRPSAGQVPTLTGGRIARPLRGGGGQSQEEEKTQDKKSDKGFFQFWSSKKPMS